MLTFASLGTTHTGNPSVRPMHSSRVVTDALLAGLATHRWRPAAWCAFLTEAARISARDARRHPRALTGLSGLHAGFLVLAKPGRRGWVVTSWLMAVSHLGLLEGRDSTRTADVVTLARANLPAVVQGRSAVVALAAVLSDKLDGLLARRASVAVPFGGYADSLADAAFWTWFAWDAEPARRWRAAALLAWFAPVVTVTASSVRGGRMQETPRPVLLRPAAALQVVLAVRALHRERRCVRGAGGR